MTTNLHKSEATSHSIAEAIRVQIAHGIILPGQPLNQVAIAGDFGTSRVPVREALQVLMSEGLVRYQRNIGYTVVRLNSNDLDAIYIMRTLLENRIFEMLRPATPDDVKKLRNINEQMAEATHIDIIRFQELNFQFHFAIFSLSPYPLILAELERLWHMSEPYRLVWATDFERRNRVLVDHIRFIDALAANDLPALKKVADAHRQRLTTSLAPILPG